MPKFLSCNWPGINIFYLTNRYLDSPDSIGHLDVYLGLIQTFDSGVLCTICFVLSMSFAQGAGNYIFTLFDNFSGTIPLLVIALCEVLAVAYCYGLRRYF